MEKLVKELLYVSKAEGTQKTEYKTVDFAEILRVQVAAVADLLEEKKQHLEANIPTRLYCEVEQELFNALKDYTDAEVEAGTMTQAEATALLEKYQ
mgnify:CR=1 FL=1